MQLQIYFSKGVGKMDDKDLIKRVKEDGVKFFSLQFTDVTGTVKSVDMPISGLEGVLEDACGSMVHLWRASPASRKVICTCGWTPTPMQFCPGVLWRGGVHVSSAISSRRMASLSKVTRVVC